MGKNVNKNNQAKKTKYDQKFSDTSGDDSSLLVENINKITDPNVMAAIVDKLLSNSLFTNTILEKLDVKTHITQEVSSQVASLENRVNELEQYSRRNCLKIAGIKEEEGEDTDVILFNLFQKLNLPITIDDTSRFHRVGRINTTSTKPRDIIVRFLSYRNRAIVYQARFDLIKANKDIAPSERVYINEALTYQRVEIFQKARQLVTDKHLSQTYTQDGVIIVKDHHNKKHKCVRLTDLAKFDPSVHVPPPTPGNVPVPLASSTPGASNNPTS